MNPLQAALDLALSSLAVFPCGADKRPLTTHGFKDATTNQQIISAWWAEHPDALIGVPTGAISGIVVLDVDMDIASGKNGEESLARLIAERGPLPVTRTARTPRGGRHLYFRYPGRAVRCGTNKPAAAIDIRGDGGYVISPPSKGGSGAYTWEVDSPMADVPPWLLKLVAEEPNQTAACPSAPGPGEICDALLHISAKCDRDTWLRVGMALHDALGDGGKAVWRDWSATAPTLLVERDLDRDWKSFKAGGGITIASVFKMARDGGWRPRDSISIERGCRTSAAPSPDPVEQVDRVWVLPNDHRTITHAAAQIFSEIAPTRTIFTRGGTVVEVVRSPDGAAELSPLTPDEFRSRLERYGPKLMAWRYTEDRAKALVQKLCSVDSAKAILGTVEARKLLPPISVVTRCPVITCDGEGRLVVAAGGYHEAGGGILVTGEIKPTESSLDQAKVALGMMLQDFDFVTPGDRSRAMAAIITPAMKMGRLISGFCPIDIAEATESQSGKGFLHRLIRAVYGEPTRLVTRKDGGVGGTDESISAALISGRPFIEIDNIRGRVESQFLEATLTNDGLIPCRVPHRAEVLVDASRVTFMATSNGMESTRDLANRASITRIRKRPHGHKFAAFPEGELMEHVKANPGYFLGAVFTVIREWQGAGAKRSQTPRHDFREWAMTLDWIVQNLLGEAPLMDGHAEAQERVSNPALTWLRLVGVAVLQAGGEGRAWRASELCELADEAGIERPPAGGREVRVEIIAGRLLKRCFGDRDAITVDDIVVTRSSATERDHEGREKPRRTYRFITSHPSPPIPPIIVDSGEPPYSSISKANGGIGGDEGGGESTPQLRLEDLPSRRTGIPD